MKRYLNGRVFTFVIRLDPWLMTSGNEHPILSYNIKALTLGDSLKEMLIECGFEHLSDVLLYSSDELQQKGLNFHHLIELIDFLDSHGLKWLLKD